MVIYDDFLLFLIGSLLCELNWVHCVNSNDSITDLNSEFQFVYNTFMPSLLARVAVH